MSTVLVFNDGSKLTTGNAPTLKVDALGRWRENPTAARHVTGIVCTLAQGETLVLTLEKVSTVIPGLQYTLSGTGWQGQALAGGAYQLTVPQPAAVQQVLAVTAVPPTPAAPAGLTITVKRQSVPLALMDAIAPA